MTGLEEVLLIACVVLLAAAIALVVQASAQKARRESHDLWLRRREVLAHDRMKGDSPQGTLYWAGYGQCAREAQENHGRGAV